MKTISKYNNLYFTSNQDRDSSISAALTLILQERATHAALLCTVAVFWYSHNNER